MSQFGSASAAPHSWDLEHWPGAVYPHTSGRARYLIRTHRSDLMVSGALVRVGRELVILGDRYTEWLRKRVSDVSGFDCAANAPRRVVNG